MPPAHDQDRQLSTAESVSILVGPNGSGKSSFLLNLALRNRRYRNVAIVCNTPHDRYTGLRGTQRLSVGKTESSPKNVVKRAVTKSLAESGAEFYQISSILNYCGYHSRFGFRFTPGRLFHQALDEFSRQLDDISIRLNDEIPIDLDEINNDFEGTDDAAKFNELERQDIELALAFLRRHSPSEPIWIDASEKALDFSRAREFASVLKLESRLRTLGVFRSVQVFLHRSEDDQIIEIHHASSGQLALISSLLFLITNTKANPLVIIDEPENSLHPNWQREYVSNVLTALNYRGPTIVVATHAPLVVTGALSDKTINVEVYEIRNENLSRLDIDSTRDAPSSIEEILWRAFDVVTPANHFVSEQIVNKVSQYEKGMTSKQEVLSLIKNLEEESFDSRQQEFFDAVRKLLDKVEVIRSGSQEND